MPMRFAVSLAVTLALAGTAGVANTPQQSPPTDQKAASPSPVITVVGCVQKESAVLKRSAAAGNIGMDDEFVLTFAALNPSPGSTEQPQADIPASPPAPVGTSGTPGNFGKVYRVTGDKENELKSYLGQRVEISGSLKDKEAAIDKMSSVGTSGSSELTPANTPEIAVDTIKPASGSCAAAIK